MFPISLNMSLKIYSRDYNFFRENLMKKIQEEFIDQTSLSIQNTDQGQIVEGAYGRFTWKGFHFFNGISKAHFKIEEKSFGISVDSKLYFFEAFFIAVIFSIIPIFTSPELKLHLQDQSYSVLILLILLIWPAFYFGNMMISALRVQIFLKKHIKKIVDEERNNILNKKIEELKTLNSKLQQTAI